MAGHAEHGAEDVSKVLGVKDGGTRRRELMKQLGEELEIWRKVAAAFERLGHRHGAKLAYENARAVKERLEKMEVSS